MSVTDRVYLGLLECMAEVLGSWQSLPSINCSGGRRRANRWRYDCCCSLLQLSAPPCHYSSQHWSPKLVSKEAEAFLASKEPKLGSSAMRALRRYEGRVSNMAVSRVLKHAHDVELAFAFFEWAAKRPGFKHRSSVYNQMLRLLCEGKKLKLSLRLINLMQQQRVALNRETFLSVAALFCSTSSCMEAGVDAFMRLRACGFTFNRFAHNCLLDAILAEDRADVDLALATYNHMLAVEEALDSHSAAALLREFCRLGRTELVSEMLRRVGEWGIQLSAVTYTECIQALGKAGEVDAALGVLQHMRTSAILDTVAFSAAMHWLCEAQRMEEAATLFEDMRASGCLPDVVAYNTLIAGHCKIGNLAAALQLFRRLDEEEAACKPNAVSFHTLVMYLCKMSMAGDALDMFSRMLAAGLEPDVNIYNTLIHCLCRLGMLPEARRVQQEMAARGCGSNSFTYGVLISAHCRAGWVDDACAYLELARRDGCAVSTICYNFIIHGFIISGRLAEACRVLRGSSMKANQYTYNLLIGAHGKCGNVDSVWELFSDMVGAGCEPDLCTFNSILHAIRRSGRAEHLQRLLTEMDRLSVLPSPQMTNVLVTTLASAGRVDEALRYLNSSGCTLELSGYNTLLGASTRAGKYQEACLIFLGMPEFSAASCEYLFKGLVAGGRNSNWDIVHSVIGRASASGLASEDVLSSCLIRVLCRAGRLHEARSYMEVMQNNGLCLTAAAYGSLLSSFCKSNELEDAMLLFQEAERCGVALDVFSYSCLMDSLSKAGMPGRCLEVFKQMNRSGCMPDVVIYNVLISCLGKHRRVREALEVLDEMATKGVMPDCRTYNTIIDILCACGKLEKAYAFFGVMRRRNHEPDVVTYNTMLNGLKLHERMDEACLLFEDMHKSKCLPDLMTYGIMIDGLVRAGRIEDAEEVHSTLLKAGLSTDVYIYNGLISGYCRCGHVSKAFETLEEMTHKRVAPNHATYAIFIIHLSRQGHTARAIHLLREMIRHGHAPSITIYNALIRGLSASGQVEEAYVFFQEMITKGFNPNTKTYSALPNYSEISP